jgi:FkbM family methyltransferase
MLACPEGIGNPVRYSKNFGQIGAPETDFQIMISNHPIFEKFKGFAGEAAAGYDRDFIGSSIRQEFWGGAQRPTAMQVEAPYPAFDEEYFEWIDVLESVAAARDSYTMIELGAGYGRWAVRAALAASQYSAVPFRLIAVEAEPVHFEWLRAHFHANGIDPQRHTLIQAAVSDSAGTASLYVGSPLGNDSPDLWYGQTLVRQDGSFDRVENETYAGLEVRRNKGGWKSIRVPQISMRSVVGKLDRVDLIDLDVQGEELTAIESAIDDLDKNTKRLHIGTHAPEIEAGLRRVLSRHGWRCLADYGCAGSRETPFGVIAFSDGVQSWLNPRLA